MVRQDNLYFLLYTHETRSCPPGYQQHYKSEIEVVWFCVFYVKLQRLEWNEWFVFTFTLKSKNLFATIVSYITERNINGSNGIHFNYYRFWHVAPVGFKVSKYEWEEKRRILTGQTVTHVIK